MDTMDTQRDERSEALQAHIIQCLTTEHFALQTGRAMTVADASSRSMLFLGTISSTLIALAFIGQISHLGTAFFLFALVLFPSLLFLGLVTFERVLQSAIEDIVCGRGINRIRHFYVELAPQVKDYFILSIHDDEAGVHGNMGMQMSWWQLFLTTAGMIAVIDSLLAGAFTALLLYQLFGSPLLPCLSIAIVIFLVVVVAHQRYQWGCWRQADRHLNVLFPSDAGDKSHEQLSGHVSTKTPTSRHSALEALRK
jgi:hypothetical protein